VRAIATAARGWGVVALACAGVAAIAATPASGAVRTGIVDQRVEFEVRNVNRSKLPCGASGAGVTIAGSLVGPSEALADRGRPANVTLYLHEFSFGEWLWHFPDPAYDYATHQARAGHVSVVVDRLGYDNSTRPRGFDTCLGADADIAHQIVSQLRTGSYRTEGLRPRAFERVVLAGHSGGGMSAQIEAYSFGDIDGLMLFSHADQGFSAYGISEGLRQGVTCALGGEPTEPGGPGGYAYFGATPTAWTRNFFHDAEPRVVDAALPLRNRDPCGNVASFATGALVDVLRIREITVPALLLFASDDSLYDQPAAGRNQARLFTGSSDVTLEFFGGGHALPLQRSAPELRVTVSDWLTRRGLG
jgi:pimeloyl-ACP methyl ester carboxylesterase